MTKLKWLMANMSRLQHPTARSSHYASLSQGLISQAWISRCSGRLCAKVDRVVWYGTKIQASLLIYTSTGAPPCGGGMGRANTTSPVVLHQCAAQFGVLRNVPEDMGAAA